MSFFKDVMKLLGKNKKHGYRQYSSSDYHRRPRRHSDSGHSHYGHSHYKRKRSSRSGSGFFSS